MANFARGVDSVRAAPSPRADRAPEPKRPPRAPLPANEAARLDALRALDLLDTESEAAYDEVARLAAEICDAPIALLGFVDETRHWFKAAVGVALTDAPRDVSFCTHAILQNDVFVVPDATADERFSNSPQVTALGVRFYAGTPLRSGAGLNVGTLCVIDVVQRELSAFQLRALRALANQVEIHFQLRLQMFELRRNEAALLLARQQKRELTALIVHDLKSPLSSVLNNAQFLVETSDGDRRDAARDIADTANRMNRMVLDLLDVERSEETSLSPKRTNVHLARLLESVRDGVLRRAIASGTTLTISIETEDDQIQADVDLLRRIVENLVDNALKYSGSAAHIGLRLRSIGDGEVELSVSDEGPGIPLDQRGRIFERYTRLDVASDPHAGSSRGLGLRFCLLAVEAHGGKISVEDNVPRGSVFCVRLPRR